MKNQIIFWIFSILSLIFIDVDGAQLRCSRMNEEYQCGSACQTTCDNLGQMCPIANIKCNDACYCKDGYARMTDDNSMCIPINQCPK